MIKNKIITYADPNLPKLSDYYKYLRKIWKSHWLTNNGSVLLEFQDKLKDYLGVENIQPVANGTLALQVAIKALDLSGEIITTPFSFAATSTSIIWERCKPIFADIDEHTYNLDPKDIENKISKKTQAILAVHVYGNPCPVDDISSISRKYKLKVIYDAAHAFGVEYKNKSVLNFGDISILSFHATKIFHTIEGGALITRNNQILDKVKLLINFGIKSEEEVLLPGINAKMNELQAAMGLCNLANIDEIISGRKAIYNYYKKLLLKSKIRFQKLSASTYNYSYMPILLNDKLTRDRLYDTLKEKGIIARKYFYPLITDFAYHTHKELNKKFKLVNSVYVSDRILCLPIHNRLLKKDLDKIVRIVNENA